MVGFREGVVGIAVDEPPVAGEVGTDRVVQHGRPGLERALDVDDGGQRLVVDDHRFRRVFGQVPASRHDHRHRLADEPRLVGGRAVVVHRRGHADRERLGQPRNVRAGDDADDAVPGERGRDVVARDARVRVRRARRWPRDARWAAGRGRR